VHPKLVQEFLGHTHIMTTLNTYSHVVPSHRVEMASAMEDVLEEEEEEYLGLARAGWSLPEG
jgi:integrase